ncbi:MAG: hypothetical protein AAFR76_11360 [Planctomycetota bacterium]
MIRNRPRVLATLFGAFVLVCVVFAASTPSDLRSIEFGTFLLVLLSSAAIVFGVLGVWIAVVYPGVLKRLSEVPKSLADEDVRLVSDLLLPLLLSTLVLFCLLLLYPLSVVATVAADSGVFSSEQIVLIEEWRRRVLLAALLIATGIEAFAVLSTLVPIGRAWWKVYDAYESHEVKKRVFRGRQKRREQKGASIGS